jgi:hypothetical protein
MKAANDAPQPLVGLSAFQKPTLVTLITTSVTGLLLRIGGFERVKVFSSASIGKPKGQRAQRRPKGGKYDH